MIDGIRIEVSSHELVETLTDRARFHEAKVAAYALQLQGVEKAREGTSDLQFSNDPRQQLGQALQRHRQQAAFFRFMADHVIPKETYRLTEQDLVRLELTDRYL
jgi:hypothetical protein